MSRPGGPAGRAFVQRTPSGAAVRRLPLRGADVMVLAIPSLFGIRLNNALVAIECDRAPDPERIRQALGRFVAACPWPAARLTRPFPWGVLRWQVDTRAPSLPPVRQVSVDSGEEVQEAIAAELNAAIDPRREAPVRFLVIDQRAGAGAARGHLVMTWFHPLMDPRGGQNLIEHLAAFDPQRDAAAPDLDPAALVPRPDPRPLLERARIARRCYLAMRTLASTVLSSPGSAAIAGGQVRFRHEQFVESEPTAAATRAQREIWWRLALVGKAMREIWTERGLPEHPFLVPISVDLRRRGDPEPTFGNMLAFHFARFRPSETADLPALAKRLREQMAAALRDDAIDANMVGMDFIKGFPPSRIAANMPWTASGELFSFAFADIAEFPPSLETLFGARVLNAWHLAAVPPRPGAGVFFNRSGAAVNLIVCWVEGALEERQVTRIVEVIREGMRWKRAGDDVHPSSMMRNDAFDGGARERRGERESAR